MKRPITWIAIAVAVATATALVAAASAPSRLSRALHAQRQLAVERPDDASVINDLGNLLALDGDVAGAETAYRRAVELAPADAAAHFNLGLLLEQRGVRTEAAEELRRVIELDPDHYWALYQLGRLAEEAGDDKRAVRYYARAFALEPKLAFAEFNPQVIENRLVAVSMLRGYRAENAAPQAPKIYNDPNRIAGLLLPPVGSHEEGTAEAGTETASGQPAVLSSDDLDDRGAVNQATPQGGGSYRPPQRAGAAASVRTRANARSWTRPQSQDTGMGGGGTAVIVPGQVGAPGKVEDDPQKRVLTPQGRVIYRPGVASTGRLDLELIPEATERAG